MPSNIYVHTLGGSAIYNLPFLMNAGSTPQEAGRDSVEGQLQTRLDAIESSQEKKYEVVSHAFVGFTADSVLSGASIGRKLLEDLPIPLLNDQIRDVYMRAKGIDHNYDFVKPLEILRKNISEHPEAKHFVIISVSPHTKDRVEHFIEIVDLVKKVGAKPILMLGCLPEASTDPHRFYKTFAISIGATLSVLVLVHVLCLAYLAVFGFKLSLGMVSLYSKSTVFAIPSVFFLLTANTSSLYKRFFQMISMIAQGQHYGMFLAKQGMKNKFIKTLEFAKKDKLPIIDLPNTFDPYQTSLYIIANFPSKEGGALIAQAICRAIVQDEQSDDSYIYTDKGFTINNPSQWCVRV